jgi:two-component system, chemotaxis family, protein-glutamate methylesterase/glutaminase
MPSHDLIVIGTSAGGVEALTVLVGNLLRQLPAAICIVSHLPPVSPSALAETLSRAGPLPATRGVDGEAITPGHIYVAPPDHHLLVEPGRIRVTRGPKENRFRPAIDASFRSAAYSPLPSHFRPRRYLFSAPEYRQEMTQRFQTWREITSTAMAA